jgi:anti-anti-sigma regulatory factor
VAAAKRANCEKRGKATMNSYLRMMSDRNTMVLTLPSLKFDSLHDHNLAELEALFQHAVERIAGTALILDVTVVQSAGASFLTHVHQFAEALKKKEITIVLVGNLKGLFRMVGWQRRFRLYPSLLDALLAWKEWSSPGEVDDQRSSGPLRNQSRRTLPPCACPSCRNQSQLSIQSSERLSP